MRLIRIMAAILQIMAAMQGAHRSTPIQPRLTSYAADVTMPSNPPIWEPSPLSSDEKWSCLPTLAFESKNEICRQIFETINGGFESIIQAMFLVNGNVAKLRDEHAQMAHLLKGEKHLFEGRLVALMQEINVKIPNNQSLEVRQDEHAVRERALEDVRRELNEMKHAHTTQCVETERKHDEMDATLKQQFANQLEEMKLAHKKHCVELEQKHSVMDAKIQQQAKKLQDKMKHVHKMQCAQHKRKDAMLSQQRQEIARLKKMQEAQATMNIEVARLKDEIKKKDAESEKAKHKMQLLQRKCSNLGEGKAKALSALGKAKTKESRSLTAKIKARDHKIGVLEMEKRHLIQRHELYIKESDERVRAKSQNCKKRSVQDAVKRSGDLGGKAKEPKYKLKSNTVERKPIEEWIEGDRWRCVCGTLHDLETMCLYCREEVRSYISCRDQPDQYGGYR